MTASRSPTPTDNAEAEPMVAVDITGAAPDGARSLSSDPRVIAAAELLAERHQPSALSTAQLRQLLAIYERRLRALLDIVGATPTTRDRIQRLQALEDALKYRRTRAAEPCADCDAASDGRCDDRDLDLIGEYEQAARRLGAGI